MTGVPRTVRLVERRSVVRPLPRADVADLLTHFRHVVDVTPDLSPGRYRLTARGWVGTFRTSNRSWEVRPKTGWGRLAFLTLPIGKTAGVGGDHAIDGAPGLLAFLAERLAMLMTEPAAAGLVRGYAERSEWSATVRGRLDLPELARSPFASPDRLPVVFDDLTVDVPWNQFPLAVARMLLARPGLKPSARAALTAAADAFAGVSDRVPDRLDLPDDSRLAPYRELFGWCRLLLASAGPVGEPEPAFLVNLEHLFQTHVANLLGRSPRLTAGWSLRPQWPIPISSETGSGPGLCLIPDLTVTDPRGEPAGVWDVKWKTLRPDGPEPADVQQVLGYAAAVGAKAAGLIYPGRRFAVSRFVAPGGVRLQLVTVRTAGRQDRVQASARRLARLVFRDQSADGSERA